MKESYKAWYEIEGVDLIDSPAFIIYKDRLKHNIAEAIRMLSGDTKRLRPHVKTHKIKEVCELLIDAGVTKFKCATISEAEMLGMAKATDVLLAYQPVGPKGKRFASLIKTYPDTQYSCLIDNLDTLEELRNLSNENNLTINVFLDINVGMNRTGIKAGDEAFDLYLKCKETERIFVRGLHAYDGHIRMSSYEERKVKCDEAIGAVIEMKTELLSKGIENITVIAGGSPSFSVHCKRAEVECSPGTFVFWDAGYETTLTEQKFMPAAVVLTRVISVIDDEKICTDLGHKSIAAENPLDKRLSLLNDVSLIPISQSEEHLVLKQHDKKHKKGDVLYALPNHICPTTALYQSALIAEDHRIVDEWDIIARNRKINI